MIPAYYDYINAENSKYSPSEIHANNTALNRYFEKYLLQRAMSVFTWDLPENWDKNYFLYILYCYGYGAVLNTDKFGVIFQQCGLYGYNIYYQPTTAVISNPLLRGNLRPRIGTQCEIIRLQPNYSGILDIVQYYANLMAMCSETAAVDLQNSKIAWIFAAKNKQGAESFKKMFDEVAGGKPASFIDKSLFEDDGSPAWQMFNNNVKNTYVVDDILESMRVIEQRFDTEIGIPTANTEKKERLIQDEVNSNNVETTSKIDLWLEMLKECCEKVNNMFNTKLSVNWRYNPEDQKGVDYAGNTVNAGTLSDK